MAACGRMVSSYTSLWVAPISRLAKLKKSPYFRHFADWVRQLQAAQDTRRTGRQQQEAKDGSFREVITRTMLSSCSCDMLVMRPSMVSIIAGLLRSIAAICRIWAAGSAPPAAGLGADAGTAAGWSVTSVITGLETAALTGICIGRHQSQHRPGSHCPNVEHSGGHFTMISRVMAVGLRISN